MKKRSKHKLMRIVAVSILCFVLCQPVTLADEQPVNVTLNGAKLAFDQNPIIENGRTLVPLRKIFESLNAFVEWDEKTQSVHAKKGATEISLTIDSNVAKVNGKEYTLDVPAKVVNGRTLVPARFVAETLKCNVGWNGDTNTVIIKTTAQAEDAENLFNVDNVVYGKYTALNGKRYNNDSYDTGELIEVKAGDTVYFTTYRIACDVRFVTAYDVNKNVLEACGKENVSQYEVPEGVGFINISISSKYTSSIKVSKSNEVDGFIPAEICVSSGKNITIYSKQLISEKRDDLIVEWDCAVGKAVDGNYVIDGNSGIGEYPLKVTVTDEDGKHIWTGESTVKIVKKEVNKMNILTIGDSLTNEKLWLGLTAENSNGNINFVGTRGSKNKHEGRSGFSSASYLRATEYTFEKEGVHPFWDGERFNWDYYKKTTGIQPDAVQIFLGINGVQNNPEKNVSNIVKMVDYIQYDDPEIPIFVINTMYKGPQAGEDHKKVFNLMEKLNAELINHENVYIVPVAITFDSENNYSESDQIHPKREAYYQIADCIYSSICAHIN